MKTHSAPNRSVAVRNTDRQNDPAPEEWSEHLLEVHVEDTDGLTICRPVGELDAFTVISSAKYWRASPAPPGC